MFMIQGEKWGGVFAIDKFYDIANISIEDNKQVLYVLIKLFLLVTLTLTLLFREAHNWFY